MLTDGIQ